MHTFLSGKNILLSVRRRLHFITHRYFAITCYDVVLYVKINNDTRRLFLVTYVKVPIHNHGVMKPIKLL